MRRESKLKAEGRVYIDVPFTEEEASQIRQRAGKAGVSAPKYVRMVVTRVINEEGLINHAST